MASEMRKISHHWTGAVLFELECDSLRECALAALKAGADLRESSLDGIDLSGARLDGARLDGARLDGASLDGASLVRARLNGARLDGATRINRFRCLDLLLLLDQPGPIRLYKLVTHDLLSPIHNRAQQLRYEIGQRIDAADGNTDETLDCGAGINVATLPWCLRHLAEAERDGKRGRILLMEFTAADVACIPTATDGKVRLHGATPVGEVDVDRILGFDTVVKPEAAENTEALA